MSDRAYTEIPVKVGDYVEKRIGREISRRFEAPVLPDDPLPMHWYRIPIPDGKSGDGSEYHVYVKIGQSDRLCIFLSGGGVAWNAYTAARPVTGGKVAAGLPNFYWNNLRPFTQIMNINTGITEIGNPRNPFDDWNFLVITYATGDFHIGNADFPFVSENGTEEILHFHGYHNFRAGMAKGRQMFPLCSRLLIAGDSAGAFAVPALAGEIAEEWYPGCPEITLLSDSGLLLYRKWKTTARDVWGAGERFVRPLHSANPTLDWYGSLHDRYGDRFRYLYASSVRDYLLSAYYNDVANRKYETNAAVQEQFFHQLRDMVHGLKKISPAFGIFLYDWKNLLRPHGGTVHTAVRHPWFYYHTRSGFSMAEWLGNAEEGRICDIGMELLSEKIRRRTIWKGHPTEADLEEE